MVDYYKLRTIIFDEVKKYLLRAQDQKAENLTDFTHKLKINFGCTDKMISKAFEEYGLRITEENEVVKIEDELFKPKRDN